MGNKKISATPPLKGNNLSVLIIDNDPTGHFEIEGISEGVRVDSTFDIYNPGRKNLFQEGVSRKNTTKITREHSTNMT